MQSYSPINNTSGKFSAMIDKALHDFWRRPHGREMESSASVITTFSINIFLFKSVFHCLEVVISDGFEQAGGVPNVGHL